MKRTDIFNALQDHLDTEAAEKAGYPPNCNEGYVEKDGKCVPAETAEEGGPYKKKKKGHKK